MTGGEMASGPECDRYADELAQLALGVATGRARAETLAHLERCPRCHTELEQLSAAADSMLEVIPGIEPPVGFEVRLAERLKAGRSTARAASRPWRGRQLSPVLACLMAAAALGAGVGAGWFVRGARAPAVGRSAFGTERGGQVATSSLVSAGRVLGYVTVYSDRASAASDDKSWLFMSLDVGSWSGEATCEVRLADGEKIALGSFWLDHGYGAWGVALPQGTGRISSASVLRGQAVLARASFGVAGAVSTPPASGYPGRSGA
jgi:hypothetical protein